MNKKQERLTATALVAGFIGLWFAVDYYQLATANDLTPFGYAVLPLIVVVSFAVCGLALLAKIVTHRHG
jgi:uncharacterized membrane protein YsdA (DUF1294 family)